MITDEEREVLDEIREYGDWFITEHRDDYEIWKWKAACLGESVDGVPDWTIYAAPGGQYRVERTIGWYEQIAEAADLSSLLLTTQAMDAADKALCLHLWTDL